jgi:hypothetical protein
MAISPKKSSQVANFLRPFTSTNRSGKHTITLVIPKRQKFVIGVGLLSALLFFSELVLGKFGIVSIYGAFILSILTDVCLFWAVRDDLDEQGEYAVFILPFFYTLSFALFYFLVPPRLLFRLELTGLYAFGLYSLYLSQNIFIVSAIRTIQLLSGGRIVSYIITLLSFFFLSTTVFSLHVYILYEAILVFIYTYLLMFHTMWMYSLGQVSKTTFLWVLGLTLCLFELALLLWFWPSSSTVVALFLTGFFYALGGMSHVWLERRLFKGVLLEYLWVIVGIFLFLLLFSSWGK